MKKYILIVFLIPLFSYAQQKDSTGGYFQLGVRSSVSMFSDDGANGFGFGGQFRIRFADRVNTDWFADYITTDIGGMARREDMHIGWSVLAYPFNCKTVKGKFTPYILAGHCFDYSKVSKNSSGEFLEKWSSAVQAGIGTHYNITDRMDVSLTAQYMMHLGKDIHAEVFELDGKKEILIEKNDVRGIEGHMLINLSFNYRLCDLWGNRKK
jgi:opacity protein-like surface antigen